MQPAQTIHHAYFLASTDPILAVEDGSGAVIEANPEAARLTGFARDELIGAAIERLLRPAAETQDRTVARADRWLLASRGGTMLPVQRETIPVAGNGSGYRLFRLRPEPPMAVTGPEEFPTIIGRSEPLREVCRLVGAVAKSDATVLIQGESGTGKEVIANAIHAHSRRRSGPFVKINCAALSEALLESELFGHVKGAFTGAIRDRRGRFKQADGGTVFLDEIGSMSPAGQAKLLRVLQERQFEAVGSSLTQTVNVRVIAATNADLAKATAAGQFREDLYYRLNVFSIPLPPLRARKEDLPLLAQHFIERYAPELGKDVRGLAPATHSLLLRHDWPGNVRELENAMEHAIIVEPGTLLQPASLPPQLRPAARERLELQGLREKLTHLERQILLDSLEQANGVKKHAANLLKIDARNLPYLLRKHRIGDGGLTRAEPGRGS